MRFWTTTTQCIITSEVLYVPLERANSTDRLRARATVGPSKQI